MKKSIKTNIIIIFSILISHFSFCQGIKYNEKTLLVDASCGQCNFDMKGKSCDLAVKINGKVYFVDGTKIDDHGDAHAVDGFCMAIKKAEIKGEIKGDRFIASYFKLVDEKIENKANTKNQ